MDHRARLRGDCARCQGLCCVSLPFDRCESFAFAKPADVPCRHLAPSFRCAIHPELAVRGQAGCAAYDCYGAGQRITQELFAGVSWQRDAGERAELLAAFRRLTRVHALRWLLHESERLALSRPRRREREQLLAELEPTHGLSRETLAELELTQLERAVHAWLRSLAEEISPERARRSLPLLTDA